MNVYQTQEAGGKFVAPLAVDVRMSFIPVKPALAKGARKLDFNVGFTFPANPLPWSFNAGDKGFGAVRVDTDGDLIPDTTFAGSSNFSPARSPERGMDKGGLGGCPPCAEVVCHSGGTEDEHCYIASPPWGCPDTMICDW